VAVIFDILVAAISLEKKLKKKDGWLESQVVLTERSMGREAEKSSKGAPGIERLNPSFRFEIVMPAVTF
jgi:hypothetical protein